MLFPSSLSSGLGRCGARCVVPVEILVERSTHHVRWATAYAPVNERLYSLPGRRANLRADVVCSGSGFEWGSGHTCHLRASLAAGGGYQLTDVCR